MPRRTSPNCQHCECGSHAWAKLSAWGVAIVSPDDAHVLAAHVWTLSATPGSDLAYAYRKVGRATTYLHREIVGAPVGKLVDHRNCNGLDDWRDNLRVTDSTGNCANQRKTRGTSRFKGVYWNKQDAVWMARIKVNSRTVYLGSFAVEADAAHAYDEAATLFFGVMARLNFPSSQAA